MSRRKTNDLLEERKMRGSRSENRESDPGSDDEPCASMRVHRKSFYAKSYNPEEDLDAEIRAIPKSTETKMKLESLVKDNLLFRALEPEQLSALIDAMTEHEVNADHELIRFGDDNYNFYVIDSGEFEIVDGGRRCSETIKRVVSGTFGELSLINNQPSELAVRSVTDGKVYALERNDYRKIVTKTNYEIRKTLEELINQVPELRDLPELDKLKVTDVLELMNFSDGETIVKEGESLKGMYMVVRGAVRLPGKTIERGGYFGELPDSKPPNCDSSEAVTAVACGPTKVAYLETQVYERLMGPCMKVLKRKPLEKNS